MTTSTKLSVNQKGLAPILIVLILAAALVGGYLVYQNQTKPISLPSQTGSTHPYPNPYSYSISANQ